ncbi:hypothetical protein DMC47_00060 [Nostoc sp. 3335mG]|nr:hypothetical protein DMC47_00060 [Nostoc sp. 3335mG]
MQAKFYRGIGDAALVGVGLLLTATTATVVAAQDRADRGAIVRQFPTNFSNDQIEKNGAMVADDIVVNVNGGAGIKPNGATYRGRDQFVAWLKGFKTVFPDAKITADEIVVSGNKVALRFTFVGTQRGELPTPDGKIAPTGRKVTLHAAEFFAFNAEGKVTRIENYSNDLSVVHQLSAR